MKRLLIAAAVVGMVALHQDFWFWRATEPLLFGFVPPGLWYHALYCLAAAALMGLLVRIAWPGHLERDVESCTSSQRGEQR